MTKEKTTEKKVVNNGGVCDDQIKMWKTKHRKVKEVEVEDEGEIHIGYFHEPKMDTLSAVNKLQKTDEVKGAIVLFENCWLGGSPMLREDAVMKLAAVGQLQGFLNVTRASVKNA